MSTSTLYRKIPSASRSWIVVKLDALSRTKSPRRLCQFSLPLVWEGKWGWRRCRQPHLTCSTWISKVDLNIGVAIDMDMKWLLKSSIPVNYSAIGRYWAGLPFLFAHEDTIALVKPVERTWRWWELAVKVRIIPWHDRSLGQQIPRVTPRECDDESHSNGQQRLHQAHWKFDQADDIFLQIREVVLAFLQESCLGEIPGFVTR